MTTSFRILGPPEITAGNPADADPGASDLLRQPRAVAVLAYLALARPRGFHSRDTLMALLWPELDAERGRKALRQTLYQIRSALGKAAIENRGYDAIALNGEVVAVDALGFVDRLEAGDAEGALDLYGGELLAGFHAAEASVEWEQWLDAERARLRREALRAAESLATSAAQEAARSSTPDSLERATRLSRRAVELAPLDESPVARLLGLLGRAGRRGEAMAVYESFAARVEEVLGTEPSPELAAVAAEAQAAPAAETVRDASSPSESVRDASSSAEPAADPATDTAAVSGAAETTSLSSGTEPPTRPALPQQGWRRPRWLLGAAALVVAVAALGWALSEDAAEPQLDRERVVILPFRVAGADPSLGYLSEGMVDLLAVRLSDPPGPRAVDPRASVGAWRRIRMDSAAVPGPSQAEAVARELGVGRTIIGEVAGSPERLEVNVVLGEVGDSRIERASAAGPADSLPELVDRLVAELLTVRGRRGPRQANVLTSVSLPALRAYLLGEAAMRRGAYERAGQHFEDALDQDSTFALAGLRLFETNGWAPTSGERGLGVVRAHMDRLPGPDRLLVETLFGSYGRNADDDLRAWLEVIDELPYRSEPWYQAGDHYFHYGRILGIPDWREQAKRHLRRAIELEPSYRAGTHLLMLQWLDGDTAGVRRSREVLAAADRGGETSLYLGWLRARMLGDSATLDSIAAEIPAWPLPAGMYVLGTSVFEGLGGEFADAGLAAMLTSADGAQARAFALREAYYHALNTGRPAAAAGYADALTALDPGADRLRVLGTLYAGLDSATGEAAARRLLSRRGGTRQEEEEEEANACVLAHYRAWNDDSEGALALVRELRGLEPDSTASRAARNCAVVVEGIVAGLQDEDADLDPLLRADSLLGHGPPLLGTGNAANLAVSMLLERNDVPEDALAASARTGYWAPGVAFLYAELRLQEAELADRLGMTQRAVQSYEHFLDIRHAPEPAMAASRQRAANALARLTGREPHPSSTR